VANAVQGNYNVVAVYDVNDSLTSTGEVILVINNFSNSTFFIQIKLSDILNGTVRSPLLSNYSHASLSNLDPSSLGFVGDSLVGYNYNSNSLIRYSANPPFQQLNSLSLGNNNGNNSSNNLEYAYKMTGEYSVVYDENARTITKVANWW
jgi:hypothetical protein